MNMAAAFSELELRYCLSEPIPQIFDAARFLDAAITAHLLGKTKLAEELMSAANMPEIRRWTKSIWADCNIHLRFPSSDTALSKESRAKLRMPSKADKAAIHERDGYNCRFCGMPVIRAETRTRIRAHYPLALSWGAKEIEQHAAFQAMWAQYDHIVPHTKGGTSDLENMVLTCAPCNFGRGSFSLAEVGIVDPRMRAAVHSDWDGLERFR